MKKREHGNKFSKILQNTFKAFGSLNIFSTEPDLTSRYRAEM